MTVRYEVDGSVAVVTIDRPDARNAVDRPTADALVDAFTRFDADDALAVAVFTGAHGTFCAGADLKAMAEHGGARINRVALDGDGPMGPTRMALTKPVIARDRGSRGRGRAGAGAVVRPAGGGRRRGVRRVLPPVGCAAHRRRHRASPAHHRPGPGARPHPHRTRGARRRSVAARSGHAGRTVGHCARRRGRVGRTSSPRSPRRACATTARRSTRRATSTSPTRSAARPSSASTPSAPPAHSTAPPDSQKAPAATAPPPPDVSAPLEGRRCRRTAPKRGQGCLMAAGMFLIASGCQREAPGNGHAGGTRPRCRRRRGRRAGRRVGRRSPHPRGPGRRASGSAASRSTRTSTGSTASSATSRSTRCASSATSSGRR